MRTLIFLGVRLALLIAMWMAWGWWAPLIALAALALIMPPKDIWGAIDMEHPMVYVRLLVELAVVVLGFIAANSAWGTPWAAAVLVIYVIGIAAS